MLDFRSVRLLNIFEHPRKLKPMEAEVQSKQEDDANIFRFHVGQIRKKYLTNPDWCQKMVTKRLTHMLTFITPSNSCMISGPPTFFIADLLKKCETQSIGHRKPTVTSFSQKEHPFWRDFFQYDRKQSGISLLLQQTPQVYYPFSSDFLYPVVYRILGRHPKNFIKVR